MKVSHLVDLGISLRKQIAILEDELDVVEKRLVEEAQKGEQVPLVDAEREGKQFIAHGTVFTVPVVFTADKIIGSFKDRSDTHGKIFMASKNQLERFYKMQTTWETIPKTGKAFRQLAGELLGADGAKMVTACLARDKAGIPKSDIKIEWESAKEI